MKQYELTCFKEKYKACKIPYFRYIIERLELYVQQYTGFKSDVYPKIRPIKDDWKVLKAAGKIL